MDTTYLAFVMVTMSATTGGLVTVSWFRQKRLLNERLRRLAGRPASHRRSRRRSGFRPPPCASPSGGKHRMRPSPVPRRPVAEDVLAEPAPVPALPQPDVSFEEYADSVLVTMFGKQHRLPMHPPAPAFARIPFRVDSSV